MDFEDLHMPDEAATMALVARVRATGTLRPLTASLRTGDLTRGGARDALALLVDYDRQTLVQLTLDALVADDQPA